MDKKTVEQMSEIFDVMGDKTRLEILLILKNNKEVCVNTITKNLSISQSAVSHQLKILKSARIVSTKRDGKHIFYKLNDKHIETLIEICYEHIMEEK